MLRVFVFALATGISTVAFADGYVAVCEPMRTGPPKKPHAEWRGPCRSKSADAKKDADEHNRQFPEHGARVKPVIDGCGEDPGA